MYIYNILVTSFMTEIHLDFSFVTVQHKRFGNNVLLLLKHVFYSDNGKVQINFNDKRKVVYSGICLGLPVRSQLIRQS